MSTETLFFKDKIIRGKDVEIIFHREDVWIYNEALFPIVSFMLTGCQDLPLVNFEGIDEYNNDGVTIGIRQEGNLSVFETTDMGGLRSKSFVRR